ncbi:MAG TPA: SidA/IucD/PvdA family monooxygenase [Pyrinomonadaceae bacterium]
MNKHSVGSDQSKGGRLGQRDSTLNAGEGHIYDYIGIGFGPSNLALAVAANERQTPPSGLFFEAKPSFRWHPGMMLEGARMQISYLKDLVTLRNPSSAYTFLQYLKAKGRLERFINLREFQPTRVEYEDYLAWVAAAFRDQVQYGVAGRHVRPVMDESGRRIAYFCVEVEQIQTKTVAAHFARNVIYAPGGRPNLLEGQIKPSPLIIHSGQFLDSFPARFPEREARHNFTVVGDGQSAAEIVAYLLEHYGRSQVHLVLKGYCLRPADDSPFVNEVFFAQGVDRFFGSGGHARREILEELRNTNYSVVDTDLLNSLYRVAYLDEINGTRRLFIHHFARLVSASENDGAVEIVVEDRAAGGRAARKCDALVLATGYRRQLDEVLFRDLLPFLRRGEDGNFVVTRHYRAEMSVETEGGLYVQGLSEASHGLGDTLLSLLPFRSLEIIDEMRVGAERAPDNGVSAQPAHAGKEIIVQHEPNYPPKRHVEEDAEKLYAVIERFPFATLVSAQESQSFVTHVPLTLDRSRGVKGVLFGHMDRYNPHVELLDGRPLLAIFHGPNAYISPHIYETNQLPTWNSITVHARGIVRRMESQRDLVRGLRGICEHVDRQPGAYRLAADDPRIGKLIDFIVGFEIEIESLEGKFKLSQDRGPRDRQLAREALIQRTEQGERAFVETFCPTT